MKFIAGISSTTALLCLVSWQGAVQNNSVSAFVAPKVPTNTLTHLIPSNNDIANAMRLETALNAEAIKITMPALSSTMKEGRVVSWLKSEGDEIEAGEAIMVVESDKADMDVEAFEDGYLAKIITDEGETAEVGAVVALIATEEADIEAVAAGGDAAPAPAAEEAAPAAEAPAAAAAPDFDFSQLDMPALSSTMKEGKVVSWLKGEGDAVEAGEAIMVVESDKADMDVEAFEDGFIAAIITDEGESTAVGAPVALIAASEADIPALQAYAATLGGAPAAAAPAAAAPAAAKAAPKAAAAPNAAASAGGRVVASPLAKKMAEEMGVDLTTVAGSGPGGRITAGDVTKAASGGAPVKKAAAAPTKPVWQPAEGVVAATPTARVLAKKAKLDLASIEGTGEFGRVTADDVKMATGEMKPKRKVAAPGAPAPVELPEGLVPFTGMQRAVSNNMVATMDCPVFRASREIEMDAFNALYQQVKPKGVTVSALLAKAVAKAIEKHPIVNSSFRPEGTFFNKDINIAMAVAIDGGLITPVLKYANERDVMELGENWKELVGKAKSGTLSPDEYNSGTFTISNMGMFGVAQFDAILPAGQGGILAVAGTQEHIVPCKQSILGLKKISKMTVTLTCDHRQIYGADAALFLKTLNEVMMNPSQLL
ncbi:dihydrolipoamide acetyltransferase [Skeletonema marinoi]|uniref:Dihydrolipoamide acetyltransferase component of pyruvate dehydrogenase complex n=1 Tax=Skeletonema marinoi TaxID=267567 RepID=A0AAD8YAL4_9STRA|nr:dihydrolipoamide acetyltransferase [Skeletonema marinoi]|mmetsp:Transcript_10209/g.15155  ORF Transcript_10209/g.15155 Transcript_10209/m.15155 type:complete len:654 (-) Transcript_10209:133-2094(-)